MTTAKVMSAEMVSDKLKTSKELRIRLIVVNIIPYLLWALILIVPSLVEAYYFKDFARNTSVIQYSYLVFPILLFSLNYLYLKKKI